MADETFKEPYLQSMLEKIARDEGFEQPKFEISPSNKDGENFVSRVFRVRITERSEKRIAQSISLIFKSSPLSLDRQKRMNSDKLFQTEGELYEIVLPTLNKLLKKYGINSSDIFPGTARCLAVRLSNVPGELGDVMVLEDKTVQGYKKLTYPSELDADHYRLVLKKLAIFHAASLALIQHERETAKRLQDIITKQEHLFYVNANHGLLQDFKKCAIENLGLLQEPFTKGNHKYQKIEKLVLDFNNELTKVNQPEDLSCIIHGDCWFGNILFRYDENGSVRDVCLLDLQLSRVASPAVDLGFSLLLNTTKEVRDTHFDEFIRFYHSELSSNLRKMDCDPDMIIPWNKLQEHLKRCAITGVLMSMAVLPLILTDSSDFIVGVDSKNIEGNIFAGSTRLSDPKRLEEISKRLTDNMDDAICRKFI